MTKSDNFKQLQQTHYKEMIDNDDIDKRRWRRNHKRKIEAINNYLEIKDGDTVVEIGVGTGLQARYLLENNTDKKFQFIGIDLSDDLLKMTADKLKEYKNVKLIAMDAENLTFEDESIDMVFVGSTIHHLADPEKGVKEMIRILKKDGKFCFMEPNYIHPKNIYFCHKHEAEKNMKYMRKNYFKMWLDPLNISYSITNFIYTPNRPDFLVPVYNIIEKIVSIIPILNQFSIMLFIYGRKNNS